MACGQMPDRPPSSQVITMANVGELPDVDLKMPPLELEFPGAPDLDLPGLELPSPALAPAQEASAPKPAPKMPPVEDEVPAEVVAQPIGQKKAGSVSLSLLLNLLSIILLIVIAGIMYAFEVPVNAVPDLSLATYVQAIWLLAGCFFVVAMLHDLKAALIITGIDILLLLTVFPTLWLLLDAPMNPLYFFVMGMIALLTFVYMPLNLLGPRKPAAA